MPWLLASPGHQQPWYWSCRIGRSLSYSMRNSNYLCLISIEEWHKMQIYVYVPSEKFSTSRVKKALHQVAALPTWLFCHCGTSAPRDAWTSCREGMLEVARGPWLPPYWYRHHTHPWTHPYSTGTCRRNIRSYLQHAIEQNYIYQKITSLITNTDISEQDGWHFAEMFVCII